MNKKLLNKIYNLIFMIIVVLLSSNKIYAFNDKIITFRVVEVPMTDELFIFKEAYGSLEDDFDDVFKEVESFVDQNGATSSRKAILYLDYGIEKNNTNTSKSAITSKESLIKYLNDTYGKSTLKSYRRVLVGYLIPPQYYLTPRDPFKGYNFKNIKVLASQSIDKDSKTPISDITNPQSDLSSNQENGNYSKANRLYDKIAMMNLLYLNTHASSSIGMMEMYDTRLKVFTFIKIPGNQNDFLGSLGISAFVKAGEFKKRPDVSIEEKENDINTAVDSTIEENSETTSIPSESTENHPQATTESNN